MHLLDEDEERWYCHTDDILFFAKQNTWNPPLEVTLERLAEAKRLAEETPEEKRARQREHVIIVSARKQGNEWKYGEDWTVDDISNYNRGYQIVRHMGSIAGGFVGGGLLGASLGYAMGGRSGKETSQAGIADGIPDLIQKKIRKRLSKDPYLYPYAPSTFHMLCPRCRFPVKVDEQLCEQCGAKVVIPVPKYLAW